MDVCIVVVELCFALFGVLHNDADFEVDVDFGSNEGSGASGRS